MKTSEVLRRAGGLLRRKGWVRGEFRATGGSMCAIGAIVYALDRNGRNKPEIEMRASRVAATVNVVAQGQATPDGEYSDWGYLVPWNNKVAKDAAEVLTAFDEAARIAESSEWTDRAWKEAP